MNPSPPLPMSKTSFWPMARIVILFLGLVFLGLLIDLRVEHVEVVRDRTIAWTPIVYSGVMALACLVAAFIWNHLARTILLVLFLAAFVVGGLGFWLHNHGDFSRPIKNDLHAWTDPAMEHPQGPPPNAPMAFCGLGLLGFIACLRRYH